MMTIRQVARCPICGNIVEVLHAGAGTLVCCGQPMQLLEANTTDAAQEKHVPVIERVDGGYRVTVGSVEHPMTPEHYIQWIELLTDEGVLRREPSRRPLPDHCPRYRSPRILQSAWSLGSKNVSFVPCTYHLLAPHTP